MHIRWLCSRLNCGFLSWCSRWRYQHDLACQQDSHKGDDILDWVGTWRKVMGLSYFRLMLLIVRDYHWHFVAKSCYHDSYLWYISSWVRTNLQTFSVSYLRFTGETKRVTRQERTKVVSCWRLRLRVSDRGRKCTIAIPALTISLSRDFEQILCFSDPESLSRGMLILCRPKLIYNHLYLLWSLTVKITFRYEWNW